MRLIDADALIKTIIGSAIMVDSAYLKRPIEIMRDAVKQCVKMIQNAPTVNEWISVKERLPQDEQWVAALLYGLVGYNTILLQYNAFLKEFITDDGIEFDIDDVAYWVGLPEPPEVEG